MLNHTKLLAPLLIISLFGRLDGRAQETSADIRAEDLKRHVKYLASDELEGRAPGTEGNRKAASYIAGLFDAYGLRPVGDAGTFFQSFEFTSGVELGDSNSLTFTVSGDQVNAVSLLPDRDFRPLGFSSSAELSAPLVFAGYGISAPDLGYDDYEGLDVSGKIVAVFRYTPSGNDPHSDMYKHGSFRTKARVARENGAAGVLVVGSPQDDPDDDLVKLSFDQTPATSGIPIVSLKHSAFDKLLESQGTSSTRLQDSIIQSRKPLSLVLPNVIVNLSVDVRLIRSTTANVVGYTSSAEARQEERILVIGAHMDHLGRGGPGTGSLVPDSHDIHNGADDNASGTAGLLELAEAFGAQSTPGETGLLFIAFSGEEMGTLGSIHYVENPVFPLDRTAAMINMDMIGRLRDGSLTVYGTGTSPGWKDLLAQQNRDSSFHLNMVDDGYGPSDHAPFYGKDIPVLFFFTGSHNEYHKPSDDWETLNYEGAESTVRYIASVARAITAQRESPEFVRVQSAMPSPGGGGEGRPFTVTLGVIPDYAAEGEGMKIGGIRPGGPAEKAGLEPGDVIVGMKGKQILNIYDYMGILGELKAGDVVELDIVRGTDRKTFTATMQPRQ
jgi:hypothetical protein